MKSKFYYTTLILLLIILNGNAQQISYLKFNKNGEFKIVQFTDTHINQKKESIQLVLDVVNKVVKAEQPDLVVFTGDIVTEDNPGDAFGKIGEVMTAHETNWVVVLGNHDDEHNAGRPEVAKLLTTLPYCLNQVSENITGTTNFVLTVGEGKKMALLYFMDSNAYSTLKDKVEGYGWFDLSQIIWYKKVSNKFTKENSDKPLPALAFFHIPLPEYNQVWDSQEIKTFGVKNEKVCCPDINTGMFAAMVEAGDVLGTFVGHDHVNDYIGVLYNIALAYGRCSGARNAYGDLPPGGRVILLKEGKREFDSWIREVNGNVVQKTTYPDSFKPKKN
jgi:predicted phosphodiesterase